MHGTGPSLKWLDYHDAIQTLEAQGDYWQAAILALDYSPGKPYNAAIALRYHQKILRKYHFDPSVLNPTDLANQYVTYQQGITRQREWSAIAIETPKVCVQQIYAANAQALRTLFSQFVQDVVKLIGIAKQNYAVLALGSLGFNSATPYSDLEYAIVVENHNQQAYFSALAELFCLRLVLLGETPVDPILYKKFVTTASVPFKSPPSGLSPDPGGQIFVGTIDDYVTQVWPEQPLSIRTVLLRSAVIYGDPNIATRFKHCFAQRLQHNVKAFATYLLWSDLDRYDARRIIYRQGGATMNMKHNFYRNYTVLLHTLMVVHNVEANSYWELLQQLHRVGFLDWAQFARLTSLLDQIMRLRLRAQHRMGYQQPHVTMEFVSQLVDVEQLATQIEWVKQAVRHLLRTDWQQNPFNAQSIRLALSIPSSWNILKQVQIRITHAIDHGQLDTAQRWLGCYQTGMQATPGYRCGYNLYLASYHRLHAALAVCQRDYDRALYQAQCVLRADQDHYGHLHPNLIATYKLLIKIHTLREEPTKASQAGNAMQNIYGCFFGEPSLQPTASVPPRLRQHRLGYRLA